MNKLKELETQYKAIKPPEQDVSHGISFKVNQQGILEISSVGAEKTSSSSMLRLDSEQTQAVFDYLKTLGYM